MGSATSKAPRKLPKTTSSRVAPATTESTRPQPEKPLAFESKNETVERDAKDPHLTEKLNQLGPVRVDHHMRTVRAASDARNMYHSRMRSESDAAGPARSTQNRLLASSLAELLEARKAVRDGTELEALARRYHIDVAKLEQLARVMNVPSIDENTVVRMTDKRGEESVIMMARWVDPVPSHV